MKLYVNNVTTMDYKVTDGFWIFFVDLAEHIRPINFKLFLLPQFLSDFSEAWDEWCEGKGLQSYRADFKYVHKLG